MGRKWTEEEKKAFGAKMKALREAKKAAEAEPTSPLEVVAEQVEETVPEPQNEPVEPKETVVTESNTEEIMRRAVEAIGILTELQVKNGTAPSGPTVERGKLTGTLDRFSTKESDYTNFTGRLMKEPGLARFGFQENYELSWKFELVRYQTIDNIWMQEPKITIDLIRKIYDEETNELTNGRYKEYRIVIHEDPDSAVWVARQNGIDVDAFGEQEFLNEMRYLQVRDWLLECFMPKRPTSHNNRREMVVNGKLVEYFEVNSENATSKLPFDRLDTKV